MPFAGDKKADVDVAGKQARVEPATSRLDADKDDYVGVLN